MKKLNVGIIGFGMSASVFHGPIMSSLDYFNIAAIVCSREETVLAAKKRFPDAEVTNNAEKVINDEKIDLIIVATPNISHYDLATKALRAKKHVIVEKPFTVTTMEADELIQLAKEQERILTVYQNRRWDSDFLTIKSVVNKGLLGEVVEYEARFDRFRNVVKNGWREEELPGSGILYDLGSHLIDQALCLFGLPNEVRADIRTQRADAKCDDNFEVVLNYDKLKVTLKAGMLVREALPHFTLLGNKGSFVKYGLDVQEDALKKGETPSTLANWGEEPESIWGTLNTEIEGLHFRGKLASINGDYRKFYENVHRAILKEEELIVRPEESRNTIRIIELAIESNKQKKTLQFQ